MKKISINLLLISLMLLSGFTRISAANEATSTADVLNPDHWKTQALLNIIPFWTQTIDNDYGGFYTDVNENGSISGAGKKYPRMISRLVYGFSVAYLLSGDSKYLDLAAHGMEYLKSYGWDKDYGGWYTSTDENNEPDTAEKNLFDETYGNLGPVLYFFTTGDRDALSYVQKTHALMQNKAWDKEYGGYFASVGRHWENITSMKSFNAEIDTCTAYLIYYYMATKDPALLADIKNLGDAVVKHMINPKTGFVGEKFTQNWKSKEDWLWAGHNLKTGWVMMRMYYLTGDKKYAEAAKKIAAAQLKYTLDKKYGGWLFRFSNNDPSSYDDSKDWWTQEEGDNLMLNMYHYTTDKNYLDKFQKSAMFWDNNFIDKQYGECYNTLARDGTPTNRAKGTLFKSAYHTMEHALLNYLYLNLYVNKSDATLYFNLSADSSGQQHYVNLVEDPAVIIKSVEIDGKDWKNFDAKKGIITLPQGKNMKVRVIFGIKI